MSHLEQEWGTSTDRLLNLDQTLWRRIRIGALEVEDRRCMDSRSKEELTNARPYKLPSYKYSVWRRR